MHFINNSATYRGGAIYADESSSTLDIVDAVQYKTAVGLSKPCFLQTAADFSYSFNSTNNGTASVSTGCFAFFLKYGMILERGRVDLRQILWYSRKYVPRYNGK